jgi:phage I-like protein
MIMAIRVNKKEEKTLERAQKDAEMVSEFAKDARNRKEAKTVSKRLESEIEDREENQVNTNSVSLSAQQQEHEIEKILDKTKDNIQLTTRTAAKELPQYTRMIGDMQEETVKTMREVADDYIESQKEIINLYQSVDSTSRKCK